MVIFENLLHNHSAQNAFIYSYDYGKTYFSSNNSFIHACRQSVWLTSCRIKNKAKFIFLCHLVNINLNY